MRTISAPFVNPSSFADAFNINLYELNHGSGWYKLVIGEDGVEDIDFISANEEISVRDVEDIKTKLLELYDEATVDYMTDGLGLKQEEDWWELHLTETEMHVYFKVRR